MSPHDDHPVYQPGFLARPPAPDTHFIAVELGVNAGGQICHPRRDRCRIHFGALHQRIGLRPFTDRLFPGLAQCGVNERLQLANVANGLEKIFNDLHPGRERAVGCPDVKGYALRWIGFSAGRVEPVDPVAGPDSSPFTDVTPRVQVQFVLPDNAAVVLTQIVNSAGVPLLPLETVGSFSAAKFQILLAAAMGARNVEAHE